MTVKELFEKIKSLIQDNSHVEDFKVAVRLSTPSIGAVAIGEIESSYVGFDWDHGNYILTTKTPINLKHENEEIFDQARDLLAYIATKPNKNRSYEQITALNIFKRVGVDIMEYQHIFHPNKDS